MATVSVIIPAYNRADVIKRAIDSAITQTFKDLEIIVVDDGSTDDTVEIVRSIPDDRIRCIQCKINRGPGTARNEGIKAANGKYIAFLDSDDEWLPEKIEKQVAQMESLSEDWGISCTGTKIIKDGCRETFIIPDMGKSGSVFCHFVYGRIHVPTPALMLRAACLKHVGLFDERLRVGEDDELLFRISRKYKLSVLQEPMAIVHMSTTKQRSQFIEPARLLILEKHRATVREELGWYAARYFGAHTFWLIAELKFRDRKLCSGLSYWLRSMTATPFLSPTRYLRIMLAMSGLLPSIKSIVEYVHKKCVRKTHKTYAKI